MSTAPTVISDEVWQALGERIASAAAEKGLEAGMVRAAMAGLSPDETVLALANSQPEHVRTPGAYIRLLVSPERVARGRTLHKSHAALLSTLEDRYGVPGNILIAIWAIETNFGDKKGTHQVIRALATLAAAGGRRADFWFGELLSVFEIADREKIEPGAMLGSWAGAMGQTQFIPSTFLNYAVDADGDGRRDVWASTADALGSAANYLAESGWRRGLDWGFEVRLADSFNYANAAPDRARTLQEWRTLGVSPAGTGQTLAGQPDAAMRLILPEGAPAPKFLISENFIAILTYNRSQSYALAVGLLASVISGSASVPNNWRDPADVLTRDEIRELQSGLVKLGWETGGIDGIMGAKSVTAIRAFQLREGLIADGYPSKALSDLVAKAVARKQAAD